MNILSKAIMASAVFTIPLLAGCTLKLVQPHDAQLYTNTEQFYKSAASLLSKGEQSSPANLQQLAALSAQHVNPHPGHYSQFQAAYEQLVIESNALILRSLANTGTLSTPGKQLQAGVERLLQQGLSTQCDALQRDFPDADLTTRNYIDLKCLVVKWQGEHRQASQQILYKATWQARNNTLFDGILAIQSAETSKHRATGENR
ncbi:hypothetical protein [Pseudomonas sp. MN1F]|uniref:hypothetical protein n=1 Tax=Pseudomonas sp. MN1F TaxID=1366632 RepID=UPI00128FB713|nr:hypothetical protein [Pseudomonas sp. MN1F]MQG95035.1 hypothetical protein [Pseudomonas sp. MN1F]